VFVSRAHERLAERLDAAGFDEVMKAALRAEQALCADETPANVIRRAGRDGAPVPGSPQVITVRTPDERLIWYAATSSRSAEAIKGLGVMDGYHGILVRDDYAGWARFDAQLAGVQQCCQHLARHLKGVHDLHLDWQRWAGDVRQILKEAHAAVVSVAAAGQTALDRTCWPGCGNAMTRRSTGVRSPAGTATGTTARTTPATSSPAASKPKPGKSGYLPATSPCPGPATPASRQSRDRNGIRPFPGTGTPWPPSPATVASAPAWSPAATTASGPSTPSTPP
jgi:hypothetical protein